jgi:hypothetical protein
MGSSNAFGCGKQRGDRTHTVPIEENNIRDTTRLGRLPYRDLLFRTYTCLREWRRRVHKFYPSNPSGAVFCRLFSLRTIKLNTETSELVASS